MPALLPLLRSVCLGLLPLGLSNICASFPTLCCELSGGSWTRAGSSSAQIMASATLRRYIFAFRVAELQLCLQELGLSKKGLKGELQSRLFAYFGDYTGVAARGVNPPKEQHRLDTAARLVTQIYHRMKGLPSPEALPARETIPTAGYLQGSGDVPLAPAAPILPNGNAAAAVQAAARSNTQIRCICGSNYDRGTMIQCEDEACGVWQHCDCVGVDLNVMPEHYLCELCRLARADPFWRRVGAPVMSPVKLAPVQPPRSFPDGRTQEEDVVQVADRNFMLTHAQIDPARRQSHNFQLQVACIMMGDSVPMRIHWPRHADLRLNNMLYRPYSRNSATKLGANARDEPASVGVMCSQGRNRLWVSVMESRSFCVMVQLAQRRTMDEVKALMAPPETEQAALKRVVRQTRGVKGEGDESDDEVEIGRTVVSLRCPMSGSRMRVPARFASVGGLNAFDLDTFLDVVQRSRKWQCPHSMRNLPVQQLMVDAYLSHILARLKAVSPVQLLQGPRYAAWFCYVTLYGVHLIICQMCYFPGEVASAEEATDMAEVTEVEVSPGGEWRVGGTEGRWHSISEDPSLPIEDVKVKADPETAKQEAGSAGAFDSDSDEEMSEGEELRRAAAAAKSTVRPKPPPDVIVISDSDEEDDAEMSRQGPAPAPLRPPAPPQQHQQTGYQPAGHAPQPEASSSGRGQLQHSPNSYGRQQGPAPTGRSYVGPYPGSLPAAGGHRAADRPGGGTVVRGRGITLRLPPRPERPPSGQSPFPMSGV
ncbi:hypothetical protein COCSUDRAFT_48449 [Coccomyxa subellipsoidea C-169]|uniref:SAP domain-containing protein n=1 Tax=Coccomyxa subellipsoidea (strain C-169) TaxID=574566 RepID=I0YR66_COCSC|nr:hypothetical protein COCSUDRAFT_48449 [Coccomyxa subellipsoidea C-169]EIE20885.1 hypothetical protein COCSUDRAFT_48449 [Coccomyxa subellipsoidea C-169]|eukprot:XP_005645429.1 hypothetical protein COCSUDRAFT_48449 [Coccomyxa subellipsoidea C-169]